MAYTHIAHDCHIGKMVMLANNATLAGHISIGDHAIVGGLVAIHQFVRLAIMPLSGANLLWSRMYRLMSLPPEIGPFYMDLTASA
jgi:acyl-[acyl carrier protein]--UDP-N-acetylglucosamine O-acyltransferase